MNEVTHWDAFAARLRAVGFEHPHIHTAGHEPELDAVNDLLRHLLPDLAEDRRALEELGGTLQMEMREPPAQSLRHRDLQVGAEHADVAWVYPAGEWHQSE
jgi:hypothetical protein